MKRIRQGWNTLRRSRRSGVSLIVALCAVAVLIGLSLSIVYSSSMLLSRANRKIGRERCYQLAQSFAQVLDSELQELVSRADSQCIPVPESVEAAAHVLATHDLPVWPHIEVADIVRDAARVCVDEDMFVPARTLSVAVARMNDGEGDNIDIIQAQFLRSLSA